MSEHFQVITTHFFSIRTMHILKLLFSEMRKNENFLSYKSEIVLNKAFPILPNQKEHHTAEERTLHQKHAMQKQC